MTRRLLVIGGDRDPADSEMSLIYAQAERAGRAESEVFRSTDILATIARSKLAPLDLLDIYHHGGPGLMYFGRVDGRCLPLFSSDRDDEPLYTAIPLADLRACLAPTAQVRLLGCSTGAGPSGRMLVYKLARELGEQRVVWGTIGSVIPQHFVDGRFAYERPLLFSSHEATYGQARDWDDRQRAIPRYRPTDMTQRIPTPKST